MTRFFAGFLAVVCSLLIFTGAGASLPAPAPPDNGGYVRDQTGTLSSAEVQTLNEQIDAYKKRTGVEMAVLMVSTLGNDDYIENFSLTVARSWGVGQEGKNTGALLVVVKDDRKMRIEVGTGLEGDLTDIRASRIIRDRIAPKFRDGNFFEGIVSGINGMQLAVAAEKDASLGVADTDSNTENTMTFLGVAAYFFIFGLSWLGSLWGRSKRWWPGGVVGGLAGGGFGFVLSQSLWGALVSAGIVAVIGSVFDMIVSRNYTRAVEKGSSPSWWAGGPWSGGGGIDSGSGGGFGGFGGGGGFSGGGSSGGW